MEFAFKYGIWEFLIHDLTPETQLLCIKDQLHIIFDKFFCDLCF